MGEGSTGTGSTEVDTQPSPAALANDQTRTTNDRDANNDPRNPDQPKEGGIGGGLLPWLLMGLGVAVAGAGGVAFYMIRIVSRESF